MAAFTTHKWQGKTFFNIFKKFKLQLYTLRYNFILQYSDIPVRLDTHWILLNGPCANAEPSGIGRALNQSADVST